MGLPVDSTSVAHKDEYQKYVQLKVRYCISKSLLVCWLHAW